MVESENLKEGFNLLTKPIIANHLDNIFFWKKNIDDKKEDWQYFRQLIYDFALDAYKESYEKASNIQQNLIKKKKGVSSINLTNFIRRFAGFEAIMKFQENANLAMEDNLFLNLVSK